MCVYGSFPTQGNPKTTLKFYSPYYEDLENGTPPILGNPHIYIYIYIQESAHALDLAGALYEL